MCLLPYPSFYVKKGQGNKWVAIPFGNPFSSLKIDYALGKLSHSSFYWMVVQLIRNKVFFIKQAFLESRKF